MKRFTLTLHLMLAACNVSAGDVYWVGYQNDCMTGPPPVAHFSDGDNWFGYAVPEASDTVILGSGFDPEEDGFPERISFGDFCAVAPGCPSDIYQSAVDAAIGKLIIGAGNWFFNFDDGGYGFCDQPGVLTGNLATQGQVIIGGLTPGGNRGFIAEVCLLGEGTLSSLGGIGNGIHLGELPEFVGGLRLVGPRSHLLVNGGLQVGWGGEGYLSIAEYCEVDSPYEINIGTFSRARGEVYVNGDSAHISTFGAMRIGREGGGMLSVGNRAKAVAGSATVGDLPGGSGQLFMQGFGSDFKVNSTLIIGREGVGFAKLASRSLAISESSTIGEFAAASGEVIVTGAGTAFRVASRLVVGAGGEGLLQVEEGGLVECGYLIVAEQAESSGEILVRDDSAVFCDAGLSVGVEGVGTLRVEDDALVAATTLTVGGKGRIEGNAFLWSDVINDGIMDPGTGQLTIDGSYRQNESGTLSIDLAPAANGNLSVYGECILGGTLKLVRVNSYLPSVGTEFHIVKSTSIDSMFTNSTGFDLGNGTTLSAVDRSDGIWLIVTQFGDFDGDNLLTLSDLPAFAIAIQGPAAHGIAPDLAAANFVVDESVDLRDIAAFQNNYAGG